jgi:hypothetical protein
MDQGEYSFSPSTRQRKRGQTSGTVTKPCFNGPERVVMQYGLSDSWPAEYLNSRTFLEIASALDEQHALVVNREQSIRGRKVRHVWWLFYVIFRNSVQK